MLASSRSRSREEDRLRPKVGWEKRPDGRIFAKDRSFHRFSLRMVSGLARQWLGMHARLEPLASASIWPGDWQRGRLAGY